MTVSPEPAPAVRISDPGGLEALGWGSDFAAAVPAGAGGRVPGRVGRTDRGVCTVYTGDGVLRASIGGGLLAVAARDPLRLPAAGDWVLVQQWPDDRLTVEAVLPRRTAVTRVGTGRDSLGQVLAANVDVAAVVEPLDPDPDPGRVERLLSLVWESGAEPVLVLTKADRVPDPDAVAAEFAAAAPGVPLHPVNGRDPATLAPLRRHLTAGRTLGLFGPSGAGKSTLVNSLVGADVMTTRALRADGRGRHTTTYRALVPVPGGGTVLDTPGLRLVGLYDAETGLDRTFADVAALAEKCRFTDCRHTTEPCCAVLAAVRSGELAPRRLESWRKLATEQRREADRRRVRTLAAERSARLARRTERGTVRDTDRDRPDPDG